MKHGVLTMPASYIYAQLIKFKGKGNDLPRRADVHQYETRQIQMLEIPSTRLKTNPAAIGYHLYNKLPEDVKRLQVSKFEKTVKDILLKGVYYSVEEYMRSPMQLE